jgi:glycerol-3-phosphate dehydrogenase
VFPGGAIGDIDQFVAKVRFTWPFLGEDRADRMAHAYGSLLSEMLAGVGSETDMGEDLGGGLTELEARWMRDREWARGADDALDRRSKIGLHITPAQRARVEAWWVANG